MNHLFIPIVAKQTHKHTNIQTQPLEWHDTARMTTTRDRMHVAVSEYQPHPRRISVDANGFFIKLRILQ